MKTTISLLISSLTLVVCMGLSLENKAAGEANASKTRVTILYAKDLYPLATHWTGACALVNPGWDIEMQAVSGPVENGISADDLLLITETGLQGASPAWKMVVGREVVVPVVNPANPWINHLREHGVSAEMLAGILTDPGKAGWGSLTGGEAKMPLRIILSDEPAVWSILEKYIGGSIFTPGFYLEASSKVAARVAADPGAIGFCRLAEVLDPETRNFLPGVALLPIDKNANGKLDYMEQIYDNAGSFSRGVWIGKYPRELSNDVYLAAARQPLAGAQADFVRWVLAGGQMSLARVGLSGLEYSEAQSKIGRLDEITMATNTPQKIVALPGTVLFIIGSIVLLGLIVLGVAGIGRRKGTINPESTGGTGAGFDENTLSVPGGLYYDNTHTWAFMEADGSVKVGIDDFLQHVTGQVTRVVLKKEGEKIKKGEALLSIIQDGKQLDIYAPLSGTIREHNKTLDHHAEKINDAPYSDGWVYRIAPSNWLKEIMLLKMADKYTHWLKAEVARVKDFMAAILQSRNLEPSPIILQDGGMLKDGLLEEFGPEVWEDFQTKILDTGK